MYSVTRCPQVTGVYFGVCVAPPVGRVALDVGALRGCMCLLWIRRRGQAQREACAQLSVWMRLREGRVILLQVVGWRGPGGQCPPPAASLPSLPLACCVWGMHTAFGVMRVAPSCDPLRDDDDGATLGLWLRRGSHSRAWVGESPLCLHPAPFASCIPSPNAKDRVNRSHVRFLM